MTRAWHQVVVLQAVQQRVHAGQREDLPEPLLDPLAQNGAVVRRDAFVRGRPRLEHRAQFRFLLFGEPPCGAGLTLGNQRVDAAGAVATDPLIHELT